MTIHDRGHVIAGRLETIRLLALSSTHRVEQLEGKLEDIDAMIETAGLSDSEAGTLTAPVLEELAATFFRMTAALCALDHLAVAIKSLKDESRRRRDAGSTPPGATS